MSSGDSNPNGRPPAGPVSEESLVDWIDGAVPPDQAERLAKASGRADLPGRVAQMQRHRAVLRDLPAQTAPAELHDRVMAAIERDVLLGVGDSGASEPRGGFVEPRLRIAGTRAESPISRFIRGNTPRLALAAGLMLMAGGLAYFGSIAWKASNTPTAPDSTEIAINDPNEMVQGESPTVSNEKVTTTIALDNEPATAPTIDAATAFAQAPREVPIDRAVELAGEGRLVVRVLATKPENLGRIERDVAKVREQRQWRLNSSVPAEVVAAIVPQPKDRAAPVFADSRQATLAMLGSYIGPGAALSMVTAGATDPLAKVRGTFLLDVPQTREQLLIVSTVFKTQLGASVVFEELPVALAAPTAAHAQDVLWWTQGPSQWVKRATVPLIVEAR